MDCGVPSRTSGILTDDIRKRIDRIRTENFEIFNPSRYSAPAAIAQVPDFSNGAVGSRIPDNKVWQKYLKYYPITNFLLEIVANPDLGDDQKYIQPMHSTYIQPVRQGHFSIKDIIICMKEIFEHDVKYADLRIVPYSLTKILFVAFHSNTIGGHLNVYRTYQWICQRHFWSSMYQYCKRMCKACPGCSLSNITQNRCADLVYIFPIDAPMRILFVDIYDAGTEINFDGTKHYLIGTCGMTYFGIYEPTAEKNLSAFTSALMKIWLRFGFSHTILVDKDRNFLAFFLRLLHSLTSTFMSYPVKIMIK